LTTHYDHPASYLLSSFIPTYGPAVLFRFHLLTYLIYLAIVSLEETFAYSGYSVMPTSFFLGGIARRVDLHLLHDGTGNFGPWGILDWVCGTTVGDTIEDDIREDLEDSEIDEKIYRMMERSKKKARATAAKGGKSRRRRNS
jgi:sterol desaturase/sphingolipid hydroxylase (fatty acid hydroxylase superfamily)